MAPTITARPGRPRNVKLDGIMAELSCTRRHAARLLREMENRTSTVSANPPLSPVGAARLQKLVVEISLLESKLRQAKLDERRQAGELLYRSEAVEISSRAHQAVANVIGTMPKTLAPRLVNQPQKAAEKTLTEWADNLLALLEQAIGAVQTPHTL